MSETASDFENAAAGDGSASSERGTGSSGRCREEYKVAGDKVVEKLKELLHEGNVRHIVIRNEDGKTLIEIPVAFGVAGALLIPVWAAVGAVAAIVSKCTIEIERQDDAE